MLRRILPYLLFISLLFSGCAYERKESGPIKNASYSSQEAKTSRIKQYFSGLVDRVDEIGTSLEETRKDLKKEYGMEIRKNRFRYTMPITENWDFKAQAGTKEITACLEFKF